MLSPLNHRWRSVRAVLGLIVIGCSPWTRRSPWRPDRTPNTGNASAWNAPTHTRSCSSTSVVDPIDVVWYGGGPVPGGVGAVLSKHGWDENDYQDPTLQALEQLGLGGVDRQYVHEIGTTEGAEECFGDDTQRATGNPFGNRNHVRLFSTVNRNKKLSVVGDAHHDKVVLFHGCEQAIIGGHIASNYNGAREAIASIGRFTPRCTTGATTGRSGNATALTPTVTDGSYMPQPSSRGLPDTTRSTLKSPRSQAAPRLAARSRSAPGNGRAARPPFSISGAISTPKTKLHADRWSHLQHLEPQPAIKKRL